MIAATQLRPGMVVKFNNELYSVFSMVHRTPGNLARFCTGEDAKLPIGFYDGAPFFIRRQSGAGISR